MYDIESNVDSAIYNAFMTVEGMVEAEISSSVHRAWNSETCIIRLTIPNICFVPWKFNILTNQIAVYAVIVCR